MAIEIVDVPIKNGDFPWQNVSSPEGIPFIFHEYPHIAISGPKFHESRAPCRARRAAPTAGQPCPRLGNL